MSWQTPLALCLWALFGILVMVLLLLLVGLRQAITNLKARMKAQRTSAGRRAFGQTPLG